MIGIYFPPSFAILGLGEKRGKIYLELEKNAFHPENSHKYLNCCWFFYDGIFGA
jgi:hypothetical protein